MKSSSSLIYIPHINSRQSCLTLEPQTALRRQYIGLFTRKVLKYLGHGLRNVVMEFGVIVEGLKKLPPLLDVLRFHRRYSVLESY